MKKYVCGPWWSQLMCLLQYASCQFTEFLYLEKSSIVHVTVFVLHSSVVEMNTACLELTGKSVINNYNYYLSQVSFASISDTWRHYHH